MKKIIFILIPSLIIAVIIYLLFQLIIERNSDKGALQVTSVPASKVYLNDKYIGLTPLCECDGQNMLTSGDYTVRLEPNDKNFLPYVEKITISKSVLTVVDREFGKPGYSEGSVISLTPLTDPNASELMVSSFPDKADVTLDSNDVGTTPYFLKSTTASDHVLLLKKNGYSEKIVRIRTPAGYKLQAVVYLAVSNVDITPTPTAGSSATPTPTPTAKVTILDTPTGFLRVHSDSSIVSSEIGRVHPGETYPLISQTTDWFEIKLQNGQTGWISSQYAKIQ